MSETMELASGGALSHGTAAGPGPPTSHQPAQTYWIPHHSAKGCGEYGPEQEAGSTEACTGRVRSGTHEKSEQPKGTLGPSERKERLVPVGFRRTHRGT